MAVLLVVGLMSLVWMAALTLVIVAERTWRHGPAMLRLVGSALAVLGVAIAAHPAVLPALAAVTGAMAGG